jgi:thioredoxin 1
MSVLTLTTSNFRREVVESDRPVIVDFHADWCGPCRQIAPAIKALSEKWDGEVRFGKGRCGCQPEIARGYNISSIPAVLRFEDGEVTNWCLGAKPVYLMEKELRLTRKGVRARGESGGGLFGRLFGRS